MVRRVVPSHVQRRPAEVSKITIALLAVIVIFLYVGSLAVVANWKLSGAGEPEDKGGQNPEKVAQLEEKVKQAQDEADGLKQERDQAKAERDQAKAETERLRKIIDEAPDLQRLEQTRNEAADLKAKLDRTEAELQRLKQPADVVPATLLDEAFEVYRQVLSEKSDHPDQYQLKEKARLYLLAAQARQRKQQPAQADKFYQEALPILQQLVGFFPAVPEYRQELARALTEQGFFLLLLGDETREKEQREAWQRGRSRLEELVREFPAIQAYRQELAMSHCNLGWLFQQRQQLREARDEYVKALTLQRKLKDEVPNYLDTKSELAATLDNFASLLALEGKSADAERSWKEALSLHLAALDGKKGNPANPTYRIRFRTHYLMWADVLARRGAYGEALKAIEELLKGYPESWQIYSDAVSFLAGCVPHINKDAKLAEEYASRAVVLLREMANKGLQTLEQLKENPVFNPLRSRADFQKLLAELEAAQG